MKRVIIENSDNDEVSEDSEHSLKIGLTLMKYEAKASISRRTTPCAVKRSLPLDVQHEHGPEPEVSINNIYTNLVQD
eukprot:2894609-Heterocapsa_arctica.AAC.1